MKKKVEIDRPASSGVRREVHENTLNSLGLRLRQHWQLFTFYFLL